MLSVSVLRPCVRENEMCGLCVKIRKVFCQLRKKRQSAFITGIKVVALVRLVSIFRPGCHDRNGIASLELLLFFKKRNRLHLDRSPGVICLVLRPL
jgi:hypothetical protein